MEGVSGLQGVLTDLFGQYMSGDMKYEEYAANVQMIQQGDPDMFQQVQDVNTAQKGKMLDSLQFDTDGYGMDNWSDAGLRNIKSGNLDVPFGIEGNDSFLPIGEEVLGAAGSDGRVFMSGRAVAGNDRPLPEVLRHEGSHSVFNFPDIGRSAEEGLVRQRDNQYSQINNTAQSSIPQMTEVQANQLDYINSNVNNRQINEPLKIKTPVEDDGSMWNQFTSMF